MHSNTDRQHNTVNRGDEICGFCLFLNSSLKWYLYSAACFCLLYPSFIAANEGQHGDNKIYFYCCLPVQNRLSSMPSGVGQLLPHVRVKLILFVTYRCPAQCEAVLAVDVAPGPTSDWQRNLVTCWLRSQSPPPAAQLPRLQKSSHDKETVQSGLGNPILLPYSM